MTRPCRIAAVVIASWTATSVALAAGTPVRIEPEDAYGELRERMVAQQIAGRLDGPAVRDPLVLTAMRTVPRHRFIPPRLAAVAYTDQPLPIGAGQTISQPYIVALMTELARVRPGHRVLEVGTGSGYQAAVLASITNEVYSVEIVEELARSAGERLRALGYPVHVRAGDGYLGWPEAAPFDAILVTAAAPRIPQPLVDQLKPEGRLVIPLGEDAQDLVVLRKSGADVIQETVISVRFVPMTGLVQEPPSAP